MSSLRALVWGAPGAREFVSVSVVVSVSFSVSVWVGRRGLPRPTEPRPSREPPRKKKKLNSEDPSGSIRDVTAHLINDKNTSIAETSLVFNEEAG